MKIDISIVVITYNQKDTILQTLESIKYQMENYHKKELIQLIIADDASKDETQKYIDKWLKKNAILFAEVNKLFSCVNRGTCKNVAEAFRHIRGEHILSIAGDDIFMNINVLKRVQEVQANEIMACPPLKFKDGCLVTDYSKYCNDMVAVFFDEKDIIRRSKFSCPIINGAIIGKDFYNEDAYVFSEHFTLLDDWPRFVRIFEKVKDFRYYYSNEPILLYRLSDKQVTNHRNPTNQIISKDVEELSRYMLTKVKNPITRTRIQMQRLQIKNPGLYRLLKFLNIGACWDLFLYHFIYKKKICVMVNKMLRYGKEHLIEEYLLEINKGARSYLGGKY